MNNKFLCNILFFILLTAPKFSFGEEITIKGKVMTTPCNDPIHPVLIYAYNAETDDLLGGAWTTEDGKYEIILNITGTSHFSWPQSGVYPNPFSNRVNIRFQAPVSGNYALNVTDVSGKKVLSRKWKLGGQMMHEAVLSGLDGPGVYFAHISGPGTRETFRLIHTGRSSSQGAHAEVNAYGIPLQLKSAKADNIRLLFRPLYLGRKDTIVSLENHENMDILYKINPQTITAQYSIHVYDSTRNVADARVVVSAKSTESDEFTLLLEGETDEQGHFSGSYQFQQTNCRNFIIREIDSLKTEIFSMFHTNVAWVDEYTPELDLEIQLNRQVEEGEFSFRILPYTADNVPLSQFLEEPYRLYFKNETSDETWIYEQPGDSALTVTVSGYPDDVLQVWHLNEKLADFIVIEHPDQYWTDKNVAQNRATYLWDHSQKFDTLRTTIEDLANHKYNKNKPLELYTPRYEYEVEGYGGGGAIVRFNGDIVFRMMGRNFGYIGNWKLPGVTHIDKIYFAFKRKSSDPWDNSEPISQEKLDEMMNFAREVLKVSNSASGRVRLPYVEHIVNSINDSIVATLSERGWTEASRSWRYDGTPNNSLIWDNANLRIKYGTAMYAIQQNHGSIYAEEFEHLYGTIDPVIGSSSAYIFELDQNNNLILNTLARTMGAVSAMSDRGTRLLPANK